MRSDLETTNWSVSRLDEGIFFFSSRRRHTRLQGDWSSDVCSSDLTLLTLGALAGTALAKEGAISKLDALPAGGLHAGQMIPVGFTILMDGVEPYKRSEERRVGKECRSRWSPYH